MMDDICINEIKIQYIYKLLLRFNIKKWLAGVKCEQDFDKLYERHQD